MRQMSLKFITFLYVLFVMTSLPLTSYSANIENYEQRIVEERIYIAPEDLLITNYGIFLLSSGEALPLTAVYVDSLGIYIKKEDKIYDTCPNGHQIYHQACGGCANWWCAFRCKCCSPW